MGLAIPNPGGVLELENAYGVCGWDTRSEAEWVNPFSIRVWQMGMADSAFALILPNLDESGYKWACWGASDDML